MAFDISVATKILESIRKSCFLKCDNFYSIIYVIAFTITKAKSVFALDWFKPTNQLIDIHVSQSRTRTLIAWTPFIMRTRLGVSFHSGRVDANSLFPSRSHQTDLLSPRSIPARPWRLTWSLFRGWQTRSSRQSDGLYIVPSSWGFLLWCSGRYALWLMSMINCFSQYTAVVVFVRSCVSVKYCVCVVLLAIFFMFWIIQ